MQAQHTRRCSSLYYLHRLRLNEARGVTWSEIADGVWTIPGTRTQDTRKNKTARKPDVIPLSVQALEFIEEVNEVLRFGGPA
jgi:integrase